MQTSMTDLFGEVIHSYTRADAIDDGYLVDVSDVAREAGFRARGHNPDRLE
jgi:type I site-specific restriction endonuclease